MIEFMVYCIIVILFIYLIPHMITLLLIAASLVFVTVDGILGFIVKIFRRQQ